MEFLKAHWAHGEPTGHCTGEDTPPPLSEPPGCVCSLWAADLLGALRQPPERCLCWPSAANAAHTPQMTSSTLEASTVTYQPCVPQRVPPAQALPEPQSPRHLHQILRDPPSALARTHRSSRTLRPRRPCLPSGLG